MAIMDKIAMRFMVGPEDAELFRRAAHKSEKTLSEWIRDALRLAAGLNRIALPGPNKPPFSVAVPAAVVPQPASSCQNLPVPAKSDEPVSTEPLLTALPVAPFSLLKKDRWVCACGQANLWRDICSSCNEKRSD